jgi:hypothetical protein
MLEEELEDLEREIGLEVSQVHNDFKKFKDSRKRLLLEIKSKKEGLSFFERKKLERYNKRYEIENSKKMIGKSVVELGESLDEDSKKYICSMCEYLFSLLNFEKNLRENIKKEKKSEYLRKIIKKWKKVKKHLLEQYRQLLEVRNSIQELLDKFDDDDKKFYKDKYFEIINNIEKCIISVSGSQSSSKDVLKKDRKEKGESVVIKAGRFANENALKIGRSAGIDKIIMLLSVAVQSTFLGLITGASFSYFGFLSLIFGIVWGGIIGIVVGVAIYGIIFSISKFLEYISPEMIKERKIEKETYELASVCAIISSSVNKGHKYFKLKEKKRSVVSKR